MNGDGGSYNRFALRALACGWVLYRTVFFPIAIAVGVLGALTILSGCATTQERPQPIVTTVEIPVPVSSPCVPANLGPKLEYPDTDAALKRAQDAAERYQLMAAGRPLREARLNELEPVVAGCPKAAK